MSVNKDGGPAYPQPQVSDGLGGIEYTEVEGMSLRDWFAGQALVGIGTWAPGEPPTLKERAESQARHAYRVADAMLEAREGEQ